MPSLTVRGCKTGRTSTGKSNSKELARNTNIIFCYYIGIDPGKNGGLCCLRGAHDTQPSVCRMPESLLDLWRWIDKWNPSYTKNPVVAVIEQVSTSPQMGVVSAGTFMRGYGTLLMGLTAAGIPFEEVRPRVWQKALGIPPRKKGTKGSVLTSGGKRKIVVHGAETDTQWKHRLRKKAQQLFPSLEVWRGTIGNQLAVADAILIAEFCRRRQEGKL